MCIAKELFDRLGGCSFSSIDYMESRAIMVYLSGRYGNGSSLHGMK